MKKILYLSTFSVLLIATIATNLHADTCMRYYSQKKYDKARDCLLNAVKHHDAGNAYYYLGEIERNAGNFGDAEKYYEMAIDSKTTNRKYLKNAYWNMLAFAERVQDFKKVAKVSKNMWLKLRDTSAKQKLDTIINKCLWTNNNDAIEKYKTGQQERQNGKTEAAIQSFNEAISLDSSFLAPKFEIGMISYKKGDMNKALSYLNEIAEKIDFYAEVHLILGEIYYSRNSYSNAIEHLNMAYEYGIIGTETEFLIRLKRGTCYYQSGDYQKALDDFKIATKLNKSSLQPFVMIAAIHIKKNDYDSALQILSRANSIQPENPIILFQMGSVYYKQDDQRYLSYFDKTFDLIRSKERYSDKYDRMISVLLDSHYKHKNYTRAAEILSFIPENRNTNEILLLGGRTYYQLKDYNRSIEYFEKVSLGNEDSYILCLAYARSGRMEKAKQTLQHLINDERFREKAKNERTLNPILKEIEATRENIQKNVN